MLFFRIAVVIVVFALVTLLFKQASGSLKLTKMNMISAIYYYVIAFNLLGASLVYLGLRDHYLIQKIRVSQTIETTYYSLAYALIMFPFVLILMKKLLSRFLPKRDIKKFVEADINVNPNMVNIQGIILIFMAICTMATAYVFMNLGYIPIVSMFKGGNLSVLRQGGSRFFRGNQYVKNLLMLTLTPFISYFNYIYYRTTKAKSWRAMFLYMAVLSVIVLTYDFSKSPIITYFLGLYLLEVMIGKIQSSRKFYKLAAAAVIFLLFIYLIVFDVGRSVLSIYSGPLGRIIFTQIATLFLHIEAFPLKHAFLHGASFNHWMSFIIPSAEGLRSGRVVMTIYNAAGVEANTAGVMNTVFIGEAYANFGYAGIIIAPIIFGIVIGFFAYMLPSLKKSPTSILLYVQMTLQYISMVEGGFVDIFYSASTIFLILMVIILRMASGRQSKNIETTLAKNEHL